MYLLSKESMECMIFSIADSVVILDYAGFRCSARQYNFIFSKVFRQFGGN